jgi:hypothetical protein
MPYTIPISDERQRDVAVEAFAPRKGAIRQHFETRDGSRPEVARLIKATEHTAYPALLRDCDQDLDALAENLIAADPELPLEQIGGRLRGGTRVYLTADGSVLSVARVLRVTTDPHGVEISRDDFVDVEATVSADASALPWSGELLPASEVVRHFALVRKLQLRHVDGQSYDFLYAIARALHESDKLLLMGSGKQGSQPLIFSRNGSSYRGFLEGRIDGSAFRLVLHLSNLEITAPPPKPGAGEDDA